MQRLQRFYRTRRRALVWAVVGALAVIGGALAVAKGLGLWGQDATLAHIHQTKVWRVGMDPSFPPFEQLDAEGRPTGFDVELAQAIGRRLGVQVEIVSVGFDQLLDAVAVHRVDSAISAMTMAEDRPRDVWYSAPYLEAGLVLAVPRGSPITEVNALAGRCVAAEWGSEGDAFARSQQQLLAAARATPAAHAATAEPTAAAAALALVLRDTPDAALDAVAQGEADAALVDAVSLALYRGGDLVAAGPPLRSDPYVVVVPARASQLLKAINEALAALEADGTLAQLRARWLEKS